MKKLKGLTPKEVENISRQVADAFYDYKYNEADQGLIKYIKSREDMFTYMNAIVQAAYKSGMLYTTSDNQEGYLMLSGEGVGRVGFFDGMKMIMAEKKALGGFKNMKSFHSEFCHPFRFMLIGRNLSDNVFIQAFASIKDSLDIIVMESVFIIILRINGLVNAIGFAHFFTSLSSIISCMAFQPIVAHLMRLACL